MNQTIAIEQAENLIREIVKTEYLRRTPRKIINSKVREAIEKTLKELIPSLRESAAKGLWAFYKAQYNELFRSFGNCVVLSAVMLLSGRSLTGETIRPTQAQRQKAIQTLEETGYDSSRLMGTETQRFTKEYMEKKVKPVLDRLSGQFATDEGTLDGRMKLRTKAEMEVRYQGHQEEIAGLKARGVKLVIVSAHADCSKRCAPYQGKVFSLDGTSGTTDDGRSYVPLEKATDIYYTTKAGKSYKNGLFGFNCRHYLVEYKKGFHFPKPNPEAERREYQITMRQRELEREVRKWNVEAIESKGLYPQRYKEARANAEKANQAYIAYSMKHKRAFYPSRTKIF